MTLIIIDDNDVNDYNHTLTIIIRAMAVILVTKKIYIIKKQKAKRTSTVNRQNTHT